MDCFLGTDNPQEEEEKKKKRRRKVLHLNLNTEEEKKQKLYENLNTEEEKKLMDCVQGRSEKEKGVLDLEIRGCSSKKENKKKKMLYLNLLRNVDGVGWFNVWYKIDPLHNTNQREFEHLPPLQIPKRHGRNRISTESCGSKLYTFGGMLHFCKSDDEFSSEIMVLDTTTEINNYYKHWKLHSHLMCAPRRAPTAVTVGKKIYVFGSNDSPQPWGEVFDTQSGTCSYVRRSAPGDIKNWGYKRSVAVHHHTILFGHHNLKDLYSYDTRANIWKLHLNHPLVSRPFIRMSFRNAVVEDVLYTSVGIYVYAFHLLKKKWYKSPVQGLLEDLTGIDFVSGFILHLGKKKLCVGVVEKLNTCLSKLYCATFVPHIQDSNSNEEDLIIAKVESRAHYLIHASGYFDAAIVEEPC